MDCGFTEICIWLGPGFIEQAKSLLGTGVFNADGGICLPLSLLYVALPLILFR